MKAAFIFSLLRGELVQLVLWHGSSNANRAACALFLHSCLGSNPTLASSAAYYLFMEGSCAGSSVCVPTTHMGDMGRVACSWLGPAPALATTGI